MRMPRMLLTLLAAICIAARASDSPTNQSASLAGAIEGECGVVIISVQNSIPKVVTERKTFDSDTYFPQDWVNAPKFTQGMVVAWQTNYEVFSKALIAAAEQAGLDSMSLSKILQVIRTAPENENLVVLPIGAHSATWKGEPVWIVGLRWDNAGAAVETGYMGHGRYFIFTRKTLKQVKFATCG